MKKLTLFSLSLLCFIFSANAQIYGTVAGSSGTSNVGIGIENPQNKFMVQGEIHVNRDFPYILFNSSYWNDYSFIQNGVTTESYANGEYMVFYNPQLKGFNFRQGSKDALTILPNGNVGIGTNNPQTLLNINIGSGGENGKAGIRIGSVDNYESLELGIDGDYNAMIRSWGNDINYYAGHWKTIGTAASENHRHNWYTSMAGSPNWSTVKMTLNHNGYLGIGTSSPEALLDIKYNSENPVNIYRATDTNGQYRWRVDQLFETYLTSANGENIVKIGQNNSWFNAGTVGIGTSTPDERFALDVEGTIRASEIKVCVEGGCDYVFADDYKLMGLDELEQFLQNNKHLPEIASEREMVENGVDMKELQMKFLMKIEELTLYA